MAKNKPEKSGLKTETKHGVIAVLCFVLGLFFLLASGGWAGVAGNATYHGLSRLFGTGFFAVPLVLVFLGISFARSVKPDFIFYRFIAGLALFLSLLALLSFPAAETTSASKIGGGWLGNLLAGSIRGVFGLYSLVLFIGLIIAALLVIFDEKPNFWTWLRGHWQTWRNRRELAPEEASDAAPVVVTPPPPATKSVGPETEPDESELVISGGSKDKTLEPSRLKRRGGGKFVPPPLSLLEADSGRPGAGDIKGNANIIKRTLQNFGIVVEMDEISIGPSITRYALKPAEGVKLSRIVALQNDLSLALAAHPLRIEAPIPGKSLVGIEIPNSQKSVVGLASLIGQADFATSPQALLLSLGRGITGGAHFANLAKAPHMLVAGATGSGKSVVIHTFITSLLYRNAPEQLRFIMIDPKRVELTLYNKIPHLLTPVITEAKRAIMALKWATKEMERRYNVLENCAVRDIASYHKNFGADEKAETMPYLVIIIDELADIMSTYPRELEGAIVRLAQMSRAVGIHLVLSTQRPSVDVITGLIKANIPARVALQVSSQIDSRTIIDMAGAEKLLGAGDMLYLAGDMGKPVRLQSAYISEAEVKKVARWLAEHYAGTESEVITLGNGGEAGGASGGLALEEENEDGDNDELYEEAREVVISAGKASASYLQRKLKVGYARAARLLDLLEERGVIGPGEGAKQREVYEKAPDHDPATL